MSPLDDFAARERELEAKHGKGFDRPAKRFSLNVAELAVIDEWLESLRPELLRIQQERGVSEPTAMPGEVYYGAIGGGVTYSFTPTGLGDIVTARESITGKELNVSDALGWHFFG